MNRLPALLLALISASLFMLSSTRPAASAPLTSCELGAYRSASGQLVTLTWTPKGITYTFLSGPRRMLAAPHPDVVCRSGKLVASDGSPFTKIHFRATDVDFVSHGVRLHGQLLEPLHQQSKPPLLIEVHGSEKWSPIGWTFQQLLTAQGVSTFVYDKRGTGKSGGVYTQDFYLLADDATAAAAAARKAAAGRYSRLGFWGGSQGGWIAPRATLAAKADFVEVAFGVVGTPVEQDQLQVDYQLREHGFQPNAAVHAITDATGRIAESNFTTGERTAAAMRAKYKDDAWYPYLDGQYTGEVLRGEFAQARSESPGVPWRYDSLAVLRELTIPQLWMFAADDATAPGAHSIERLQMLKKNGSPISIVVFPNTDHGITTFSTQGPGKRTMTGYGNGYWKLLADWAKGGISGGSYGDAHWLAK